MTLPVPNMASALVDKLGKIIPPWNSWFQQFSQPAPAVAAITLPSPFTANANGTVFFTGVTTVTIIRGTVSIILSDKIVPIRIGDALSWTGAPTVQFLGD